MTKPKLKGSWGGKIEAQGEVGVDLGSVWVDSGQVLGGQGRAPEKIRGRKYFCSFPGRRKYENVSKKLFPSGSAEAGAE